MSSATRPPGGCTSARTQIQCTTRRKSKPVEAVKSGKTTFEDASRHHELTEGRVPRLERMHDIHGLPILRATRLQQYCPPKLTGPKIIRTVLYKHPLVFTPPGGA